MAFPFNWPGQDQEALRKSSNNVFESLFGGLGESAGNWANNIGKGAEQLARTHPLVGGAMDAYGSASKALGQLTIDGPSEGRPLGSIGYRPGNMGGGGNAPQQKQAVNANRLSGLNRDSSGGGRMSSEAIPFEGSIAPLSDDEQRMQELEGLLGRDFESSGEYDAMVDEAYASALGNITKARGQANSNFQESDARVAGLTAGHVNEIQTKDRAAVEKNGSDLQSAYKETYGNARNELQGQQSAEMAAKTEMLTRLGQQEAGIGNAGQSESEALTRLTQNEAGAMQQAQGYQAADLTRNTEQAQSQASAGVERRAGLNRDLQKILGTLDNSEAEVNQSKTVAKLQGKQSEKADFRQEQQFNLDSLTQMEDRIQGKADKTWERDFAERELAAKSAGKSGSSGSVFDAVGNDLKSRGTDPAPYLEAYNAVMGSAGYNAQAHGDKNAFYAKKMKEYLKSKGINADGAKESSAVGSVVMGIHNYGTDKLGG